MIRNLTFDVSTRTDNLIVFLKKYRDEHIIEYKEAIDTYRILMKDKAKALLDRIENGNFDTVPSNLGLVKPVDCLKEYNEMISTFESIQSESIDISIIQLNQIVNNTWDWIGTANATNASYSLSLRNKLIS